MTREKTREKTRTGTRKWGGVFPRRGGGGGGGGGRNCFSGGPDGEQGRAEAFIVIQKSRRRRRVAGRRRRRREDVTGLFDVFVIAGGMPLPMVENFETRVLRMTLLLSMTLKKVLMLPMLIICWLGWNPKLVGRASTEMYCI